MDQDQAISLRTALHRCIDQAADHQLACMAHYLGVAVADDHDEQAMMMEAARKILMVLRTFPLERQFKLIKVLTARTIVVDALETQTAQITPTG